MFVSVSVFVVLVIIIVVLVLVITNPKVIVKFCKDILRCQLVPCT